MRMGTVVALIATGLLAISSLLMLRPAALEPEVLAAEFGGPPSQFVRLPGGTVARYQDFSADGAAENETLVLLHGGAMSLESWISVDRALARHAAHRCDRFAGSWVDRGDKRG